MYTRQTEWVAPSPRGFFFYPKGPERPVNLSLRHCGAMFFGTLFGSGLNNHWCLLLFDVYVTLFAITVVAWEAQSMMFVFVIHVSEGTFLYLASL